MASETFAVIDCGSHSTRLLVVQKNAAGHQILKREMKVTRLGEDVKKTGELNPEAIRRTLDCIAEYMNMLNELEPGSSLQSESAELKIIATAAAREAENSEAFFNQIEELISVRPVLLEGKREAELAFLGATHSLGALDVAGNPPKASPPYLTIDIGGGSTEFGFGTDFCEATASLPIGSFNLTEDYIAADPPQPEELYACLSLVETYLSDLKHEMPALDPPLKSSITLIGMAGTVTTAAAVELGFYDPEKVHHFILTREALEDVFRTLSREPRADRLANPGLHPDRADVIVAGLTILTKTMRFFDFQECLVSETDLMDGAIMEMVK